MEKAKIIKPTPEQEEAIKKWKESQESPLDRSIRKGKEDEKRRLELIREKSKKIDVTYDLNRWFGERMRQQDPELLAIQKNGFISMVVGWVKSTTPEEMKFGTATKEERVKEAKKFAELAGLPLEQILKEHNLKLPE